MKIKRYAYDTAPDNERIDFADHAEYQDLFHQFFQIVTPLEHEALDGETGLTDYWPGAFGGLASAVLWDWEGGPDAVYLLGVPDDVDWER